MYFFAIVLISLLFFLMLFARLMHFAFNGVSMIIIILLEDCFVLFDEICLSMEMSSLWLRENILFELLDYKRKTHQRTWR